MSNPSVTAGTGRTGLSPDEVLASSETARATSGVTADVERLLDAAQRQADEAGGAIMDIERHTRGLRRQASFAWAALAVVVVTAVGGFVSFSTSVSRAAANAEVQATLASQAREESLRIADQLRVLEQEHAVAVDRVRAAETAAEAMREEVMAKVAEVARVEAEKRHAERALQAALGALYEARGSATASVPTTP